MIEARGLSKSFGTVSALEGLTLDVRAGEVFGLLGPNGSGKTTTLRLLLGMLRPSAGTASVGGHDCWRDGLEVRRVVSYLPGELRLPGAMTSLGLLKFLCALRGGSGLDRAVAIAEGVMGLDLRRKVRALSTGMKQKLALAQAFADPVDCLILDEPTSALDPSARQLVLGLVDQARAGGQTVVFSGHVLSEVEQVSDRVAIMRRGRLMRVEDLRELRRSLRLVRVRFRGEAPALYPEALGLSLREADGPVVLLEHRGEARPLLAWLGSQDVQDVAIGTEGLEALYETYHGPNAESEGKDLV